MTTTSVNPYPNIAPPAVAEPMCDWADWDNEVPVVTNDHRDDGTNIVPSPIAGPTPNMVAVELSRWMRTLPRRRRPVLPLLVRLMNSDGWTRGSQRWGHAPWPLVDADTAQWRRMLELNTLGAMYTAHAAIPHLLAAAERNPRRVADLVFTSNHYPPRIWRRATLPISSSGAASSLSTRVEAACRCGR